MDKQFREAAIAAEIALGRDVIPHWPTYHRAMAVCRDLQEACDAARAGDVGDFLAYRGAEQKLLAMLDEVGVDPDSFANNILDTVSRTSSMSDKQARAIALAAAKAHSATQGGTL